MVPDTLAELVTVSNELAGLLGKSEAVSQSYPEATYLHPELLSVLTCGALALTRQGIDLDRVDEFTKKARARGMRQNMVVFGWHPNGLTWFAAPLNPSSTTALSSCELASRRRTPPSQSRPDWCGPHPTTMCLAQSPIYRRCG